jgi:hypothetical protein
MKNEKRMLPDHIHKPGNPHISPDVDTDFIDLSWEDSLKKHVQSFWESIDEIISE